MKAWGDASIIIEWLEDVAINGEIQAAKDQARLDDLEWAADRLAAGKPKLWDEFSRAEANACFREDEHRQLMHQWL